MKRLDETVLQKLAEQKEHVLLFGASYFAEVVARKLYDLGISVQAAVVSTQKDNPERLIILTPGNKDYSGIPVILLDDYLKNNDVYGERLGRMYG